jgi:hypothetical protein
MSVGVVASEDRASPQVTALLTSKQGQQAAATSMLLEVRPALHAFSRAGASDKGQTCLLKALGADDAEVCLFCMACCCMAGISAVLSRWI